VTPTPSLPVAVIGAGPVGLAAAAHLLERGLTPIVFEQGSEVGASVLAWAHVRMFSPWQYTVDTATVRLLGQHGWVMPPEDALPTGRELVERYMRPFANLPGVGEHIHVGARVVSVSRQHADRMKDAGRDDAPFALHIAYADGREQIVLAQAVIDASGTWNQPNPLGSGGVPALGEGRSADRIAYGIPDVPGADRARYAGRHVLVVGSGHSAINALLMLAEVRGENPATRITWAMRGRPMAAVVGGGTRDQLSARGLLGTRVQALVDDGAVEVVSPFRITEVTRTADGVRVHGDTATGPAVLDADTIIAATGARPNLDMLRELRLDLDPSVESTRALAPLIDPNIHSCGTVRPHGEAELRHPEPGFYTVGMKSYGRAPTFLLATGYEQVRSVVAALAGDWEAARDVQLNLPETGVCSTDLGGTCCTPPAAASLPVVSIASIALAEIAVRPSIAPLVTLEVPAGACCADDCCSVAEIAVHPSIAPLVTLEVPAGACCADDCCS
jgi:thioredoxin reductase